MNITPKQAEALQMQNEGLTYFEIAEQLGISQEAVSVRLMRARKRLGLPELRIRNDQANKLTKRQEQVLELKQQGFTSRQIANKLGIEKITVKEHVRNAKRRVKGQQA